jgi:hypothetical protein
MDLAQAAQWCDKVTEYLTTIENICYLFMKPVEGQFPLPSGVDQGPLFLKEI